MCGDFEQYEVEGKVQKGVGNVEHELDKADRKTR
jgi:hypothetical protein